MNMVLYILFFLTLAATFAGLLFSGVSVAVSLMLMGPVTTALFTGGAFVFLLVAVVFEKEPARPHHAHPSGDRWMAKPKLQHSNG